MAALPLAACQPAGPDADAGAADCTSISAVNTDDCIRLNQIQVLGTHNSYHLAPPPGVLATLGERGKEIEYSHRPLAVQLSRLGVRKFELDVYADPQGGRFATPVAGRVFKGLPALSAEWREPGFKVLHTPDDDYWSTCSTLKECLTEIREWSRVNPWHVPIMVMIEAKDTPREDPKSVGYIAPLPIAAAEFRALDAEIRSVFDEAHLITPDRVRGSRATLAEAVKLDGWPSLRTARGKVLFALDNTDAHRTQYLDGRPSLEGRVLFISAEPTDPAAAFLKMNEALGEDEERIRQQVRAGFLIRTRADIPTVEARNGSTTRRDSAFRSGAHYVSTDYPEPSPFGSGYQARLPGAEGLTARCNPVNAPPGCRDEWLEPPGGPGK
jgi:hypothetical protein